MRSATTSVRVPREPLTSTRSPGAQRRATTAGAASALDVEVARRPSRGMPAATAASASARAGAPPTATSSRSPAAAAARPLDSCSAVGVVAELEHLAEHRHPSGGARLARHHVERAAQRRRARVVGVVDEHDAVAQVPHHAAAVGRPQRGGGVARRRRAARRTRAPRRSPPARWPGCRARAAASRDPRRRRASPRARACRPAEVLARRVRAHVGVRRLAERDPPPGKPRGARHHARRRRRCTRARRPAAPPRGSRPWRRRSRRPTRRSRGGRRRRWSTRGRRARRCARACGSLRRDSSPVPSPPRPARSQLHQRQRQADVVVQVPLVLHDAEPRGQHRRDRLPSSSSCRRCR